MEISDEPDSHLGTKASRGYVSCVGIEGKNRSVVTFWVLDNLPWFNPKVQIMLILKVTLGEF